MSEQCDRGRELTYVVAYSSSSGPVANITISPANCTNSECRHTLDVSSVRPANYTVSVAAANVVGESRLTESRTISEYNVHSKKTPSHVVTQWDEKTKQYMHWLAECTQIKRKKYDIALTHCTALYIPNTCAVQRRPSCAFQWCTHNWSDAGLG